MKVKVCYTKLEEKVMEINDALMQQATDYDHPDIITTAINKIETEIGEGCELCAIWDETDTDCLVEL